MKPPATASELLGKPAPRDAHPGREEQGLWWQ